MDCEETVRLVIEMADRVLAGDMTSRLGLRPPGAMGDLCRAFDQLADAVAQREEKLKAVASQISQAEKHASIGRLAAGVAHEVNNPLTGVLTFAQLMTGKENLDDEDRRSLNIIVRETTRVREIVRGLLDFARETPITMRAVDFNEVVRAGLELVRGQKEFRQVKIVEDLAPGRLVVWADRNQLTQVFLNLVLNAAQAMPNGGTLTVSSRPRDCDRVEVVVADEGCGIARKDLDRIFEPFFTTKPIGSGTGLGLSVSYGIVARHRGRIDVETQEGRGSTFTVILPRAEQDPDRRESAGG
jgi:two-component system, NtrC family, sensor kinase